MPRERDLSQQGTAPSGAKGAPDEKEEIAFLRQRFSSLMLRGHYKECFKLIEDNLRLLYFKDRWPEDFLASLRLHKKSYPAMDIAQPYDEYATALLKKHGIPTVLVSMLRGTDTAIVWKTEFFRDLAVVAEGKGDFEDALGYCEILLKMDPLNSHGYLLKGWIYSDMNQTEDAIKAFNQAVERNRTNHQAWHGLSAQYRDGNPLKALECIETAIEYAPGEARYFAAKAKLLVQTGDKAAALDCYEQAALLDPLNVVYPYERGELLLSDNQTLAAMRMFSKAVGLDEKHIPSLTRLANLFAETQPETALPYINTVCSERPDDVSATLLRAKLLHRTGDRSMALKQYHKVIEKDPSCSAAYGALGDLYAAEENPQTALKHYTQASELAPQVALYHLGKAKMLEAIKQLPEAIASYQTTVSLDKQIAEAWGSLGLLHLDSKPAAAAEYLSKALELDGENAEYHQANSVALLKTGKGLQAAIDSMNLAVTYDPGNWEMQLRLAQLLEEIGNGASAIEHYRFAASLDDKCADAFYGLARLMWDTQPEIAITYINSAINLDATNGDYYHLKSKILGKLGHHQQAMDQIKAAYEKNSHNTELMEELSHMLGGESLRVALLYINRAIELAPQNSGYICTRANILYALGTPQKALGQYEAAVKMDPACHEAYYGIGKVHGEKEPKAALEALDKAISLAPETAAYYALKASILAKDEETYQQAVDCYSKATSLDNRMWEAMLEKAMLMDAHGDVVGAQESYRRTLLINRDCVQATARMGEMLAERGIAAGLSYLDHAIALEPENSTYHVWKARLLLVLGKEEQAEEECRTAIDLGAGSGEVYFTLAQVLRLKLPETALKYIGTAIGLEPQNALFYLLQGDVHRVLGEWQAAKDAYTKTISLQPGNHEAMAKMARILRREKNPEAVGLIDSAIEKDPANAEYLYIKAKVLAEVAEDIPAAVECISQAVSMEPDVVKYHQLLVDLLEQKGGKIKLFLERRKLEKCRAKALSLEQTLSSVEDLPEEPPEETPEPEEEPSGEAGEEPAQGAHQEDMREEPQEEPESQPESEDEVEPEPEPESGGEDGAGQEKEAEASI